MKYQDYNTQVFSKIGVTPRSKLHSSSKVMYATDDIKFNLRIIQNNLWSMLTSLRLRYIYANLMPMEIY